MLKIILIGFVGVIALALLYATTKPNSFRYERSIVIDAPAADIYAHIDDFRRWTAWSPYEHRDPAMKRTYSGPQSGVGAVYDWAGNSQIGSGRMQILESTPASRIVIQLDFKTPFEAHNLTEFELVPEGNSTRVTWTMSGPSPYLAKVMQLVMDMDKMVGKDFATGLGALKKTAESAPSALASSIS